VEDNLIAGAIRNTDAAIGGITELIAIAAPCDADAVVNAVATVVD